MSIIQPKTLLCIDDDVCTVYVIRVALETTAGWQVLGALSGSEGLTMAIAQPPDAILLDLKMPLMTGMETLLELKKIPTTQNIPIVFLTGRPDLAKQHQYAGLGVQAIITKPFDVLTLAHQISAALDWAD
ncbi:response regulator [Acaryochloris marina]|uniref:response regulator n=1 Tax=Acaryochloris marina TaxID=155978 RepID=UPI001BB0B91E|nr:response regulator [Acaryochloris marina]QUY46213.1 response regulator [Acaryochloris marina S15]